MTWLVSQTVAAKKELEISTPAKVQVKLQADTLDFQRFTLIAGVKIVTFAADWQDLDGLRHLTWSAHRPKLLDFLGYFFAGRLGLPLAPHPPGNYGRPHYLSGKRIARPHGNPRHAGQQPG